MTREEAIATLETAEYELSNQVGSKYCQKKYEAVKMAIKALERELILDKIRAEIEQINYLSIEDGSDGYDEYINRYDVLNIIDKYKAGKE